MSEFELGPKRAGDAAARVRAAPHKPKPSNDPASAPGPGAPRLDQLNTHRLQGKLAISDPSDACERQAEAIADGVMRMPVPTSATAQPSIQRVCDECERELSRQPLEEEEQTVGRKAQAGSLADAEVESSIDALHGRGHPLPQEARNFMEPRFRADFSAVRVHDDARAHELARAVNAQAFTVGRDVVFAAGHYDTHSDSGKRLLAHELTHVLQQGAAGHVQAQGFRVQRDEAKTQAPAEKPAEPAVSFVSPIPAGLKLGRGLSEQPVHQGLDIAMPIGTSIFAAAAGTVVHAGEIAGYGIAVDIAHGTQYTTRYAHLSELKCKLDDQVTAGQHIALSGNTGRTTGPHLHFEVRSGGRWGAALDPRSLVPFPA